MDDVELTPAQAEAAAAMMRGLIHTLKTGECSHCHSKNLKKRGRSVYCEDCGRRLYQGSLPKPQQGDEEADHA